ncbi:MAG: aldehyde dehydrogenase family protein, partial [Pseudomonadota bacterium]
MDGVWVPKTWLGASDDTIEVNNPATGDIIGAVPRFGREQTRAAIDAAETAFRSWKHETAEARGNYCLQIHDALMDNADELGRLLTIEMGKPLAEAKGEVAYAARFFKWFGEEARRLYGDVIPSS